MTCNLVPRVLRLLSQRSVTKKPEDSGYKITWLAFVNSLSLYANLVPGETPGQQLWTRLPKYSKNPGVFSRLKHSGCLRFV